MLSRRTVRAGLEQVEGGDYSKQSRDAQDQDVSFGNMPFDKVPTLNQSEFCIILFVHIIITNIICIVVVVVVDVVVTSRCQYDGYILHLLP